MTTISRGRAAEVAVSGPKSGPVATVEELAAMHRDIRSPGPKRFGTLAGVFTPTLLTTLGVIMYLRLPWVVGNAGLLGGWLIMAIAIGITTATGLSAGGQNCWSPSPIRRSSAASSGSGVGRHARQGGDGP